MGVLQAFRGPARANGSTACSWTQTLSDRLREPLVLQTQHLAIAEDRSSVGWEIHHQFCMARGAGEPARLAPDPWEGSWPQHLGVTSRKDQPPNRNATGTGRDESTHTDTEVRQQERCTLTGTALAVTGV